MNGALAAVSLTRAYDYDAAGFVNPLGFVTRLADGTWTGNYLDDLAT